VIIVCTSSYAVAKKTFEMEQREYEDGYPGSKRWMMQDKRSCQRI